MGNLFRGGSGLFIKDIAKVGWLRSLLWCWEEGIRGEHSIAMKRPFAQSV